MRGRARHARLPSKGKLPHLLATLPTLTSRATLPTLPLIPPPPSPPPSPSLTSLTPTPTPSNNRGISDGADLPEAFLSDIFTRITTDEIRMRGDAPPPLPPDAKGGKGKGAPAPAPAAADPFAALMLAKSGECGWGGGGL